jgi:branched-chain amino acid transport system permease protein
MDVFLQVVVNGILFGTMYGIAAIGLSVIFGTMRIIFLAQGSMIVLFAYFTYWLFEVAHLNPYVALLIVIPVAFLVGLGLFYTLFKKASGLEDKNVSLLLAVGLMYLLDNLMLKAFTPDPRYIKHAIAGITYHIGPINVGLPRILALVIAIAATMVVYWFLKKTLLGTEVRAAAVDMEATRLLGINSYFVAAISFAIGIGLAGTAGAVLASVYSFDPNYGFVFAIKALVVLALGGIGNVRGALVAGLLLGVIETLATYYIGAGWSDAVTYAVFILVLIFLPQGLFGSRAAIKKV